MSQPVQCSFSVKGPSSVSSVKSAAIARLVDPYGPAENGAQIVFNPSATVESLSRYLWELEQTASAAANGYWVGAINRVGVESPISEHKFYGSSYFADPKGQIVAQANDLDDAIVVADIDLDEIQRTRDTWQFFRDRRPETYAATVDVALP